MEFSSLLGQLYSFFIYTALINGAFSATKISPRIQRASIEPPESPITRINVTRYSDIDKTKQHVLYNTEFIKTTKDAAIAFVKKKIIKNTVKTKVSTGKSVNHPEKQHNSGTDVQNIQISNGQQKNKTKDVDNKFVQTKIMNTTVKTKINAENSDNKKEKQLNPRKNILNILKGHKNKTKDVGNTLVEKKNKKNIAILKTKVNFDNGENQKEKHKNSPKNVTTVEDSKDQKDKTKDIGNAFVKNQNIQNISTVKTKLGIGNTDYPKGKVQNPNIHLLNTNNSTEKENVNTDIKKYKKIATQEDQHIPVRSLDALQSQQRTTPSKKYTTPSPYTTNNLQNTTPLKTLTAPISPVIKYETDTPSQTKFHITNSRRRRRKYKKRISRFDSGERSIDAIQSYQKKISNSDNLVVGSPGTIVKPVESYIQTTITPTVRKIITSLVTTDGRSNYTDNTNILPANDLKQKGSSTEETQFIATSAIKPTPITESSPSTETVTPYYEMNTMEESKVSSFLDAISDIIADIKDLGFFNYTFEDTDTLEELINASVSEIVPLPTPRNEQKLQSDTQGMLSLPHLSRNLPVTSDQKENNKSLPKIHEGEELFVRAKKKTTSFQQIRSSEQLSPYDEDWSDEMHAQVKTVPVLKNREVQQSRLNSINNKKLTHSSEFSDYYSYEYEDDDYENDGYYEYDSYSEEVLNSETNDGIKGLMFLSPLQRGKEKNEKVKNKLGKTKNNNKNYDFESGYSDFEDTDDFDDFEDFDDSDYEYSDDWEDSFDKTTNIKGNRVDTSIGNTRFKQWLAKQQKKYQSKHHKQIPQLYHRTYFSLNPQHRQDYFRRLQLIGKLPVQRYSKYKQYLSTQSKQVQTSKNVQGRGKTISTDNALYKQDYSEDDTDYSDEYYDDEYSDEYDDDYDEYSDEYYDDNDSDDYYDDDDDENIRNNSIYNAKDRLINPKTEKKFNISTFVAKKSDFVQHEAIEHLKDVQRLKR